MVKGEVGLGLGGGGGMHHTMSLQHSYGLAHVGCFQDHMDQS